MFAPQRPACGEAASRSAKTQRPNCDNRVSERETKKASARSGRVVAPSTLRELSPVGKRLSPSSHVHTCLVTPAGRRRAAAEIRLASD